MVEVGIKNSEGISGYLQRSGHSVVVNRCIEHQLRSTLEHVDSLQYLVQTST